MDTDDLLMQRVAQGDERAFAELLTRHDALVRRLCRTMIREQLRADELAQDVFLTLWLKRSRYQPQGQLRAYLCTLARHRCLSELRRQKLFRFFAKQPQATSFDPRNADDLTRAMQAVPEQFRLPLHLRFIEDLDYDEIATIIGRTESAARSRIHYGLKALQEVIS